MILKLAGELAVLMSEFENPVDFNDFQTLSEYISSPFEFENPVDFNDSQTHVVWNIPH